MLHKSQLSDQNESNDLDLAKVQELTWHAN